MSFFGNSDRILTSIIIFCYSSLPNFLTLILKYRALNQMMPLKTSFPVTHWHITDWGLKDVMDHEVTQRHKNWRFPWFDLTKKLAFMGQLRIANCCCGSCAKNNRAPSSGLPGQSWVTVLPGPGTTSKVKEAMGGRAHSPLHWSQEQWGIQK